ncbi:hypothetical protein AB0C76_32860 [Kitasatospora sp. NPDC048722]|uniref:hypothetical protein n=1 Tax=Kitasatospora sp. NPDC048722 TaxID=3155639 RepID=UPI0033C88179
MSQREAAGGQASRFLPNPSIPVAPLGDQVHAALAAAANVRAPLLALAYPNADTPGAWVITMLTTDTADVHDHFHLTMGEWDRHTVEKELRTRGYASFAVSIGDEWTTLADGGQVTPLYRDWDDE